MLGLPWDDHTCVSVEHLSLRQWSLLVRVTVLHTCINIQRLILSPRAEEVGSTLLWHRLLRIELWSAVCGLRHHLLAWVEAPLADALRVVRLRLIVSCLIKAKAIQTGLVVVGHGLAEHNFIC